MNEHDLRDAYEASLRKGEAAPPPVEVPLDRLQMLVDREGSEAERLRTIDVLMSSAEGRREFDVAWAASRAAREYTGGSRSLLRSWRGAALTSAAVLFVAAIAIYSRDRVVDDVELLRGDESPIRLVAPGVDDVPLREARFTWRSVAGAKDYLLVVVDTAGTDVFARNTTDTSVTLPDSLAFSSGGEYLWWVQAKLSDGSTISAVTRRFRAKR
jgi:hypothetical protein